MAYIGSSTILYFSFFFFNDTATTEIYTLSLHDALPISSHEALVQRNHEIQTLTPDRVDQSLAERVRLIDTIRRECLEDRKSTRLNSSHDQISYAVFCLKKKKTLIVN